MVRRNRTAEVAAALMVADPRVPPVVDLGAVREFVARRFGAVAVEDVRALGADEVEDGTRKGIGYGLPIRVSFRDAAGHRRHVVFHTARPDRFGHDRRADRVAAMILAYDTFTTMPEHAPALDVGMIAANGSLRSLADTGEPYLMTGWADGAPYADDLRRIAVSGAADADLARVDRLATYLAALHEPREAPAWIYRRAVRDLLGSGEGIFGIIDGYPPDTPAATPERLRTIEGTCHAWRWRLRGREGRVAPTHGDFHPFNVLFDGAGHLTLLDASRGGLGEPADDLTALAVNYVFFAVDHPGAWAAGLGRMWHRLWARWLAITDDHDVLSVAAPWLAWRALVVCNPRWYPDLSPNGRDAILSWVERVLAAPLLDLHSADQVAP